MPHTETTRARAYQKMRSRRAEWLKEHGPCAVCSSIERLEVDHIDPAQKVHHAVWSWSKERMEEELLKCQVLCYDCHKKKTADEHRKRLTGRPNYHCRTMTADNIRAIRAGHAAGKSERSIAATFALSKSTVRFIILGRTYRDII